MAVGQQVCTCESGWSIRGKESELTEEGDFK